MNLYSSTPTWFRIQFLRCRRRDCTTASAQGATSYPGLFINDPGTGHKVLNSDWPIKTHNLRSNIIESRQINIANTKLRAFQQSNKRRIIIFQGNCFPRTTDASQEVHRSKMAQVKPQSKEILSSYNCVNLWRRKKCCFDILVMTQMYGVPFASLL